MDDDQERKGRLVLLGMGSSRAGAAKDGRQATNGRSMCLRTRSVSLAVHALRQVTTRGRARVSETSAECQPVAVCFSASHLPANRLTQPQPRQELRRLTCSTTTRWPHQPSARSTHRTRQSRAPLRRALVVAARGESGTRPPTAPRSAGGPWRPRWPGARRPSDWRAVTSGPAKRTASREEEKRRASPSSARIATAVTSPTPKWPINARKSDWRRA